MDDHPTVGLQGKSIKPHFIGYIVHRLIRREGIINTPIGIQSGNPLAVERYRRLCKRYQLGEISGNEDAPFFVHCDKEHHVIGYRRLEALVLVPVCLETHDPTGEVTSYHDLVVGL